MDEPFELPVNYKGKTLNLPAQLVVFGYSHRILVWIEDVEVSFEPDEERNYRASLDTSKTPHSKLPDVALLEIIARGIETLIR